MRVRAIWILLFLLAAGGAVAEGTAQRVQALDFLLERLPEQMRLVATTREQMGADDPIRHVVMIGEGDAPHDLSYEDALAAAEPTMPEEPEETDPVVLMYTGGTTGLPNRQRVTWFFSWRLEVVKGSATMAVYRRLYSMGPFQVTAGIALIGFHTTSAV